MAAGVRVAVWGHVGFYCTYCACWHDDIEDCTYEKRASLADWNALCARFIANVQAWLNGRPAP